MESIVSVLELDRLALDRRGEVFEGVASLTGALAAEGFVVLERSAAEGREAEDREVEDREAEDFVAGALDTEVLADDLGVERFASEVLEVEDSVVSALPTEA